MSPYPVKYFNGDVSLESNDLGSSGFGAPWGQVRKYANLASDGVNYGYGPNWFAGNWPFLMHPNPFNLHWITLSGDPGGGTTFHGNFEEDGYYYPYQGETGKYWFLYVGYDEAVLYHNDGTRRYFNLPLIAYGSDIQPDGSNRPGGWKKNRATGREHD